MLLCPEDSIDVMCLEEEEEAVAPAPAGKRRGRSPDADFGADLFPPQTEECVAGLVERELEHMPQADYGDRLRAGGVDLRVRGVAVDWIWKVRSRLSTGLGKVKQTFFLLFLPRSHDFRCSFSRKMGVYRIWI
jgi:cyclin D1/2/4